MGEQYIDWFTPGGFSIDTGNGYETLGFNSYAGAPSNSTEEIKLAQMFLSPQEYQAFQTARYNVEQRHDLGQFNDQYNALVTYRRKIKQATQTLQQTNPDVFDASGKIAAVTGQPTAGDASAAEASAAAAAAAKQKLYDQPLTAAMSAAGRERTAVPVGSPTTAEELFTQAAVDSRNRVLSPDYWRQSEDLDRQQREKFDQDTQTLLAMAQNDPSVMSLLQLSKGEGPAADAAKAALRSGLDAANNMAMSQAASARGGAGARALAVRSAIASGAQATQRAANQSQALLAQMAMQGIEGLAKQRGENMVMAGGVARDRAGMLGDQSNRATNRTNISETAARGYMQDAWGVPTSSANRGVQAATGSSGTPQAVAPGSAKETLGPAVGAWDGAVRGVDKLLPPPPEPTKPAVTVSGAGTTLPAAPKPERDAAFNPFG
jgi:hypothetical protein